MLWRAGSVSIFLKENFECLLGEKYIGLGSVVGMC
jgi:hypothetical protein